jgi:hypothetical protein
MTPDSIALNGHTSPAMTPGGESESHSGFDRQRMVTQRAERARRMMKCKSPSVKMLESEGGCTQADFVEPDNISMVSLGALKIVSSFSSTGNWDEAKVELESMISNAPTVRDAGIAFLLLAELFNKWGAALPEYTTPLAEQGAALLFACNLDTKRTASPVCPQVHVRTRVELVLCCELSARSAQATRFRSVLACSTHRFAAQAASMLCRRVKCFGPK